jgi:protein-tyrosine phosphatase
MAEFVLKHMVSELGYSESFLINSAATSTEEIGSPIHYGTKEILKKYKIPFDTHYATQMTKMDYEAYDYLIGMDSANIRNMLRISNGDPKQKIHKLLSYTGSDADVADPWYTHDFEKTYRDISIGCKALLHDFPFFKLL